MENKDNVEGDELVAGDCECEADEDGVEDDTELEDEYSRHLCGIGLRDDAAFFVIRAKLRIVSVITGMAEMVLSNLATAWVALAGCDFSAVLEADGIVVGS